MRVSRIALAMVVAGALAAAVSLGGCSDASTEPTSGSDTPTVAQDGLEVGEEAPELRLKNQDQATIVLSDYEGTKNVILVFYPLAFTPV